MLAGVSDWPPPFEYAHPDHDRFARVFEPFIAAGFSDEEAWSALFDDAHRLEVFRVVYGNRKRPAPRNPWKVARDFERTPTLFSTEVAS